MGGGGKVTVGLVVMSQWYCNGWTTVGVVKLFDGTTCM